MSKRSIHTNLLRGFYFVLPAFALLAYAPAPAHANWNDISLERVTATTTRATRLAQQGDCYNAQLLMNSLRNYNYNYRLSGASNRTTIATLISNANAVVNHNCFTGSVISIYQQITAITDEAEALATGGNCAQATAKMAQARTMASKINKNNKDYELGQGLVASGDANVAYSCSAPAVDEGGDIIAYAKRTTALALGGQCSEAQSTYDKANNLLKESSTQVTMGIAKYLSQAKTALLQSCGIGAASDTASEQLFTSMQGPTDAAKLAQTVTQPSNSTDGQSSATQTPTAMDNFTSVVNYTTQATSQAKAGNCQGSLQSLSQAQYIAQKYATQDTSLNFNNLITFASQNYEQYCVRGGVKSGVTQ